MPAQTLRLAAIPGDGIGPEVIREGIRVADAAARRFGVALQWTRFPWGADYYLANGVMMPEDGLDRLREFDAIFLGAVGDPRIQDHLTLNGLLLPIRRGFDQFACVRPVRTYQGIPSLLSREPLIDLVVVRENTEGEYAQAGGNIHQGGDQEVAVQTAVFTRRGTERIIRFAFDLARGRRKRLTSITKSNAQGFSMVFWDRVFAEVAADYPDVSTESLLVDAACIHLVRRAESFDVLVASNLFGDIISDLAPALAGSLGLAASANLDPSRRNPSMFEPVHGSAPDIAGKGLANPAAAILSAAMMLDFLGQRAAAQSIEHAVERVIAARVASTPDLGGHASTEAMSTAIIAALEEAA